VKDEVADNDKVALPENEMLGLFDDVSENEAV